MEQLKRILAGLSWKQRFTIAAAVFAVVAGLVMLERWNRERDFKPLLSGLAPEDAGAVVARLRESGVDYRLSENGSAVMVPSERVAETRLQLASAGLPKSGRMGFELFDKTNFGVTEFAEQINYHRALEGELERSIVSIAEVEQARVHVTFAKDSVFAEQRQPAKASVLVKLRAGASLSPPHVNAICYLTASAVQGLAPESVSVVDMRGNLLNRARRPLTASSEDAEASIEYRRQVERDLLAKINATLEPLLGAERFRAGVYAECDFSSGEQSEETFDPSRSVIATSQRTEDISGSSGAGGIPGTASNLPRPAPKPAASAGGVTRRTENVAYQASRVVKHTRLPQGGIRRVSAAVLLDHAVRWQGEGAKAKRIIEPLAPERLKVIRDLLTAAIGISAARGDQLTVECLPFESTLSWEPPPAPVSKTTPAAPGLPAWLQALFANKTVIVAGAAGAGLMILLAATLLVMFLRRKRGKPEVRATASTALPPAGKPLVPAADEEVTRRMEAQLAEQAALKEKATAEALNSLKLPQVTTKKTDILTRHLSEEAKKDPTAMAHLVRTWLSESES